MAQKPAARPDSSAPPQDALFPMRVVMRMTGLTADSIRVWERRYGAVVPHRTSGQARRYDEAQVRKLSLLAAAVKQGHSIGAIANASEKELRRLVDDDSHSQTGDPHASAERIAEQYLRALRSYSLHEADEVLSRAAASTPLVTLASRVLPSIVRKVGEAWHAGTLSVAHEHAATQQVISLLDRLYVRRASARGAVRIVFAAPEGHDHDVGLRIGALLANEFGANAMLLGANMPLKSLHDAATRSKAALIVLGVARDLDEGERKQLPAKIRALARDIPVWIGVPRNHALSRLPAPVRVFEVFDEFVASLETFAAAGANR